ncbi:uncharacterized protein PG998_011747 [Apiospora kogelbergensis]|uniref:uncharacterized protein n=1 Tax=Apiospora kogelbergensis TaxID=1337665 RepID=UPI003132457D
MSAAVDHSTSIEKTATTGSEHPNGANANQRYEYGNPMAHVHTGNEGRLAAFGGEFQPGLYRPVENRKFANPAPLGLSAFALTTFVLSLINVGARDVTQPNIIISLAFGYGGLVQLLAGMWLLDLVRHHPHPGFAAASPYTKAADEESVIGFYLAGWFIFTTILLLCTLRSTVMFFLLFFTLDLAFLMLFCHYLAASNGAAKASLGLQKAGGVFGLLAAFIAWYNAFAGIADSSNSFFLIPVFHFPWSEKGRASRGKTARETV